MVKQWKLKGSYFETCDCEAACPCNFKGPPTDGRCTVLIGWHIDVGSFDGTGIDGLTVAEVVHSPGHMLQTKREVALHLDDRASAAQASAVTRSFQATRTPTA